MPIHIDQPTARTILRAESAAAAEPVQPEEVDLWRARVSRLGELCPHGKSSTTIAALGTALLAKCVNAEVDVHSLLDRDVSANSYSARTLADTVWAPLRAELDIDLGANGANPLNNTPFIGKASIREIENVKNRDGWSWFIECMGQAEAIATTDTARHALRGFILARRKSVLGRIEVGTRAGDTLALGALINAFEAFLSEASDGGRRAQAVVAGTLAAVFTGERVIVGHINDPDRRAPLDVSILDEETNVIAAVEVKDRPVTSADVARSVEKTVTDHGVMHIVFVALANAERPAWIEEITAWAGDRGVNLTVHTDLRTFVGACRSYPGQESSRFEGRALRQTVRYAETLGVPGAGIQSMLARAGPTPANDP